MKRPAPEALELAERLTLILLLFSSWVVGEAFVYRVPLQLLAILGLAVPAALRRRAFWALPALVMSAKTLDDWWVQDNHLFLLNYWLIALALGRLHPQPGRSTATAARWLIGLGFLFATLWKAWLSSDYMSGGYFHFTLLTDLRFHDFSALAGGVSEEALQRNAATLALIGDAARDVREGVLRSTDRLELVARVVTYWTVAIEGLLALVFLARPLARWRNVLLLLFGFTTYLVAHVPSFGWTLMILGIAQCEETGEERNARTRWLYVLACLWILMCAEVPILPFVRAAL